MPQVVKMCLDNIGTSADTLESVRDRISVSGIAKDSSNVLLNSSCKLSHWEQGNGAFLISFTE